MDPGQRAKGRSRGRARGSDNSGASQRPGTSARPPPYQPAGAWGQRGAASQGPSPIQPLPSWGPRSQVEQQRQIRAPAPPLASSMQVGRATYRVAVSEPGAESEAVGGGGEAGVAMHSGRGALRGRRPINDVIIRTRPQSVQTTKQGTTGKKVRLSANYFMLLKQTNWCLYQYRVDFAPNEDQTKMRKKMLRNAAHQTVPGYIFDGTVLYCSTKLDPDPLELFSMLEGAEEPTRITIRLVGDIAIGDFQYLQIFNIIMRKCMGHLNLQLVGRNFYDALARVPIPEHKLELWPGYITSIRQHENDILLCCEVTHKTMRTDTVLHLLTDCAQEDRANYKNNFQSRVIGSVVLTDYNNRTYRVDDVDWDSSPSSTFRKADGSNISYLQYYETKYNIRISVQQQPMLVSRMKAREVRSGRNETVYLVPQLCRMTGLTDAQRANFNLMRSLSGHTRVGPRARIEKLLNYSRRLLAVPEIVRDFREWDLEFSNQLVEFSGRILPKETIIDGRKEKYSADKDFDWTRELRSRPMFELADCPTWVIICPSRYKNSAYSFMRLLQKAANGMSWYLPGPKLHELTDDRPVTYLQGLDTVINTLNPKLIMCVVSNNRADRYAAIKKKCCGDCAVPTQVILAKNLESKGAMSIATKVAIQMNCKLGGAPWTVEMPVKGMMVVGYDVCHDSNHKSKSYAATVCSLNKQCTRYFAAVSSHMDGEELSNDFALTLITCCQKYKAQNQVLPETILIYRDGVGDGQLQYVYEHEVNNIKSKLKETLYPNNSLKLTFIIVSKRINTRIFYKDGNPVPGTVVDDIITLPQRYDFFIVSQCVNQGTVSPTSYNVLEDNIGLSPDHLQRITYKLTHLYFNWSGTVRVPAPCQYAHKLAFLVGQSIHGTPNPGLESVLYYL